MAISDIDKKKVNKMNRASQNISLGTIIQNLASMSNQSASAVIITGGSIVVSNLTSASASIDHLTAGSIVTERLTSASVVSTQISSATAKFGDATNYTEFSSDGTMTFSGSATVYNDIILPVSNLRPGNTPPSFVAFQNGIYGFSFADGAVDELHGAQEIEHDYKEGTSLEVHVHWSPSSTNVGYCAWRYEYSIANMTTGSFATSTTLAPTSGSASAGIVNQHLYTSLGTIPGTIAGSPVKIGAIIAFRVYRDGNAGVDTFTGNAFLHSVGIHYESDSLGSRSITEK